MTSDRTHTPGPWIATFGAHSCQIETQDTSDGAFAC